MGFVHHLAIQLHRARALCLGKRIHNALCMLQFFGSGLKALVDDGNLIGMNGQFAAETLASGAFLSRFMGGEPMKLATKVLAGRV